MEKVDVKDKSTGKKNFIVVFDKVYPQHIYNIYNTNYKRYNVIQRSKTHLSFIFYDDSTIKI